LVVYKTKRLSIHFQPHLTLHVMTSDPLFYYLSITHLPAYSQTLNSLTSSLDISLTKLEDDTRVNTLSPLLAASLFIQPSSLLPPSRAQAFIFTSNMLNEVVNPACLGSGIGKSSSAHLISMASLLYGLQGRKEACFYPTSILGKCVLLCG
jgi:hypothetical protein